jgi:hypothetical protein
MWCFVLAQTQIGRTGTNGRLSVGLLDTGGKSFVLGVTSSCVMDGRLHLVLLDAGEHDQYTGERERAQDTAERERAGEWPGRSDGAEGRLHLVLLDTAEPERAQDTAEIERVQDTAEPERAQKRPGGTGGAPA